MSAREHSWEKVTATQATLGRFGTIVFLAIIVKAMLIFGLLPNVLSHFSQHYNVSTFGDGSDLIAWNLVQGNGYRMFPDGNLTMLRTPGFVLLLALIFAVFGKSLIAVQVVNLVFSCVTAVLTQVLACKAGLSKTAAAIAFLVFFFHPGVIFAESRVGAESMLTLCLVVSVLFAVIAKDRQTWPCFAMAGFVFGLALLVKPTVAPVLPAWFLYSIWKTSSGAARRRIIAGMAICGIVTVLVMTPWVVRNYRISGEFIPTMTLSGLAAFQGVHVIKHLNSNLEPYQILSQAADEQFAIANAMALKMHGRQEYGALDLARDPERPFFPQFLKVEDEVSFYRELGRRAVDDCRRQPELILKAIVHNTWAFWAAGKTHLATMLNAVLAVPLLALAGIGLITGIKRGLGVFQYFLIVVVFMIPHLILFAYARYYLPVVPFLAVLVAIPLANWLESLTLGAGRFAKC